MKHLVFSMLLLVAGHLFGQVTISNNLPGAGNYVGFNNTSNIPLPIRNDGFREIDISSNGNNKFAITELPVWNGLNGLTRNNVQRTTMGLQGEQNIGWSILHLRSDIPSALPGGMQRPWMNVGTSYTANQDFMYTGLLERPDATGNLKTDAVIAWGCQDTPGNPDNFRFIFLRPQGGGAPSQQVQGLETMRITPWGSVGVGDVFNNNLQPPRRLTVVQRTDSAQFRIAWQLNANPVLGQHSDFQASDLGNLHIKARNNNAPRSVAIGFLNNELSDPINNALTTTALDVGGITRVRELPDSLPASIIMGYQIDGAQQNASDHFLGRIDFPGDTCLVLNGTGQWIDICNGSGADLDWETNGFSLWTGHGLNGYPAGNAGIGIQGPGTLAKLHVKTTASTQPANTTAIRAETVSSSPPSPINTGLEIWANGGLGATYGSITYIFANNSNTNFGADLKIATAASSNYGYHGSVDGAALQNYGAHLTTIGGNTDYNYGIFGEACNGNRNFGVYGKTCGTNNGNFAGYFEGDITFTGSFIPPSDVNLKTDIQEIENPSEILGQLSPKIYHFNQDVAGMNLAEGPQLGLIAQEVEEVLPFLVQNLVKPAVMDSAGNVLVEEFNYKGLKYLNFIALLIAGFNEQQALTGVQGALLSSQDETIAANEVLIGQMQSELEVQASTIEAMEAKMLAFESKMAAFDQKTKNCCPQQGQGSGAILQNQPNLIELGQNIPNPFESGTRIDFYLPSDVDVILEISDAQGRPLRTLIDGKMGSGNHTTTFDGSALAPGVYYYSLYADGQLITKRMLKM